MPAGSWLRRVYPIGTVIAGKPVIGENIWLRFNATKAQQGWYYTSIANIIVEKGKQNNVLELFGREMNALCKKVF